MAPLKVTTLAILALFLWATAALAQMSEVEFDLLSARMAKALKAGEFEKALPLIEQIKDSGREFTPSLIYFEGFALENLGQLSDAETTYRRYMERAGKSGAYYNKALGRIVEIEDQISAKMERYRSLIKAKRTKESEAELAELERVLGDRAASLKAAHEAAEAKALEERERKEAEAAKLKAEEDARIAVEVAKRSKNTWETIIDKPQGWQRLYSPAVLPDGNIIVVGDSARGPCKASNGLLNNWWVTVLNAAGDVVLDEDHCAHRAGFGFHSFLNTASVTPEGFVLTAGVVHSGKKQLAAVHIIDPKDGKPTLSGKHPEIVADAPNFHSLFIGGSPIPSGGLVAAGFAVANDTKYGIITTFDATGTRQWASPINGDHASRKYQSALGLRDGRAIALGTVTEPFFFSEQDVGIIDVYDPNSPDVMVDPDGVFLPRGTEIRLEARRTPMRAIELSSGEIIVTGHYKTYSDVDEHRGMIAILNPDLSIKWKKEDFGEEGRNSRFFTVAEHDGGFVVGGGYETDRGDWDAWLLKFDTAGQMLWERKFGDAGADTFSGIAALPDKKGLIVTGSKGGAGWVMKLTNDGKLQ